MSDSSYSGQFSYLRNGCFETTESETSPNYFGWPFRVQISYHRAQREQGRLFPTNPDRFSTYSDSPTPSAMSSCERIRASGSSIKFWTITSSAPTCSVISSSSVPTVSGLPEMAQGPLAR